MMWNGIKRQLKLQWKEWRPGWAVTAGGGSFGLVFMCIVRHVDSSAETSFLLGTLMASIIASVYVFSAGHIGFAAFFTLEIAHGCTRKEFFISYYICCLLQGLLLVCIPTAFGWLERSLYSRWFDGAVEGVWIVPWIPAAGILLAVVIPMLAALWGLLMMRYGRKVFWIAWTLWMLAFLVIPKCLDAAKHHPASWAGQAGAVILRAAKLLMPWQWIAAGIALSLVLFWGAWRLTLRQDVTRV